MSFQCAIGNPAKVKPCTRWGCSPDLRPCPVNSKQIHFSRSFKPERCRQRDTACVQAHNKAQSQSQPSLVSSVQLAAAAAAAIVAFSSPAWAEIQTVAPGQAAQYAQPIPQQTVNKRTVWLLFGGGAAAIFGSALLLEKNQSLFPAIYKANETMRKAKEADQARALTEKAVSNLEQQDDMRLQRSVEAGLANAQARVLPDAFSSHSEHQEAPQSAASSSSNVSADSVASQNSADQKVSTKASRSQEQQIQGQSVPGQGSTLSDEEKQKAAVSSVK